MDSKILPRGCVPNNVVVVVCFTHSWPLVQRHRYEAKLLPGKFF